MQIVRPIVFLDLETTGTDINKDRIVEIGIIKINMDGSKEEKKRLVNPEMNIPISASEVHGITDETVAGERTFKEIAKSLLSYLNDCDFGGYNLDKFDIPVLIEEFARCGLDFPSKDAKIVDVIKLERLHNSHKLSDTYQRYFNKPLEGAHGALTDATATLEILVEILDRYYDKETSVNKLHEMLQEEIEGRVDYAGKLKYNDTGDIIWNFGPHKDKPVLSNIGFFNWVLANDFPASTKLILIHHQRKVFDEKNNNNNKTD